MKKSLLSAVVASLFATAPLAQAAVTNYNVTTTWFEPDEEPDHSIFIGSFTYDNVTKTVSNLQGSLSEAMTGDDTGWPGMYKLELKYQNNSPANPTSWYDSELGGTFAATFLNSATPTFDNGVWKPAAGIAIGATYLGDPGVGNAYALIFVPDNPLNGLTQPQINKLAYADCTTGGMMGQQCMTGTSVAGYGSVGTMSGYPLSQTITVAVPEPETYAMFLAGLGLMGGIARRRKASA